MKKLEEPESTDTDEELVRSITQAQRRLFAFILSLVRRAADAEDVLQETNVVLWRKRRDFQLGSDFYAWAFEIARLQVLSWRRKTGRETDSFDVALLSLIAEAAISESENFSRREAALRGCLQKLTESQRALVMRRYHPHVAVNSLAAEMGKSAKAVSETLRRIRETLRRCIERTLAAESS